MQTTTSNVAEQSGIPEEDKEKGKGLKGWHYCLCGCLFVLPILFLVCIAVVAAGVGVAVPYFQDELINAQHTKVQQDMDVLRSAINLHDAQNKPLQGSDFKPLRGRYLQEIPKDPWGNPYLLDASVGLIASYGADAQVGGSGCDKDLYVHFKPPLKLWRAQYDGEWGIPKSGAKIILLLTKPFELVDKQAMFKGLVIMAANGVSVSLADLNAKHGHQWAIEPDTNASLGKLVLVNESDGTSQPIELDMYMAFALDSTPVEENDMVRYGIKELPVKSGPLDRAIYGLAVQTYLRSPETVLSSEIRTDGVNLKHY